MEKRALQLASVASMIDLFNTNNINILCSLGYLVDVATNFEEGSITSQERVNEFRKELNEQKIGTYQIPIPRSIRKVRNIVKSYKMVKKLVEEMQYQVVHCHSPIGGVICRVACREARKNGTKVIYTAHGFHFFEGAPKIAWLIYYPIEKWCSKYTDVLITMNQEDYSNGQKLQAKRVEFVPGVGVRINEIGNIIVDKTAIRKNLGFTEKDFVFMSTGQLSVRKNHELVIKALAKIQDTNVKYLIVGFGEEEERLKKLAKELNLEKRIVFAGYQRDVKKILHVVDAFAFPSLQEGLPVALMEAMAAGLPVVCTKIRGNTDLIEAGKGGYLYDCRDVEGFAEGMKNVVKGNAKNMGLFNKNNIERYDCKFVNSVMMKIYKEVAGES